MLSSKEEREFPGTDVIAQLPAALSASGDRITTNDSLVARPRLLETLRHPGRGTVTLVTAGAGYGKTSLARSWAAAADIPIAWIEITTADNDQWIFSRRIIHELGKKANAPNSPPPAESQYADPGRLASEISGIAQRFSLILDDCEKIQNAHIFELLDAVIAHLPAEGSLVFISRVSLPLRLGRLRALGQVVEIDQADLRFTIAETSSLLGKSLHVPIPEDVAWQLWNETRGWAAGIALAASARSHDLGSNGHTGDRRVHWHRYVDEYVRQEIIGPLKEPAKSFVLATADLPYLSADLCRAALGESLSEIDDDMLSQFMAFVEPSATDRRRSHVHPLVGMSLRRMARTRIPDPERQVRQAQAVRHLLDQGETSAAAHLALHAVDAPWVNELIVPICERLANRSNFDGLLELLNQVPRSLLDANPELQYWHVASRLGLRQTLGIGDELDANEAILQELGYALGLGRIALCRGLLAYHEHMRETAEGKLQEALELLPITATVERQHAHTMLGQLDLDAGKDGDAAAHLGAAGDCARLLPLDEQWSWIAIGAERGNTYAFRGDLHSAITKYDLLIHELPSALGHLEGLLRCRLVPLWIERDNLERAEAELKRAERLRTEYPGSWHHDLTIAKVRWLAAKGDWEAAEHWAASYLKQVRRLPEKNQLVLILARIWLGRGELSLVRHWLADMEAGNLGEVRFFGDISKELVAIDADLAQSRFEDALAKSHVITREAEAASRWSVSIEAGMRQAVAVHYLGDQEQGLELARKAIKRGLPGGFVRSFLVPGFDTTILFADAWQESGEAIEAKRHLHHMHGAAHADGLSRMTSRELEILQHVARGESNHEIADALFISVNTVRNHLVKVFRRLDARSRSEAVARARQHGILD